MSAYKIISVVGTSSKSWEDATQSAVGAAAKSLRDLRIGKVTEMDVTRASSRSTAAWWTSASST
jgi:flavin-binding protein dodecin